MAVIQKLKKQHTHTQTRPKLTSLSAAMKSHRPVLHEPSSFLNWQTVSHSNHFRLVKPCDRTKRKSSSPFPLREPTSWSSPYQCVISHINQWRSGNWQPFIWSRSHCREIPKDTTTNTGTFQRKAAVSGGIQSKNLLYLYRSTEGRVSNSYWNDANNNMRMEVLIVRILTFGRPWRRQLYWSYYWIICPICCLHINLQYQSNSPSFVTHKGSLSNSFLYKCKLWPKRPPIFFMCLCFLSCGTFN